MVTDEWVRSVGRKPNMASALEYIKSRKIDLDNVKTSMAYERARCEAGQFVRAFLKGEDHYPLVICEIDAMNAIIGYVVAVDAWEALYHIDGVSTSPSLPYSEVKLLREYKAGVKQ